MKTQVSKILLPGFFRSPHVERGAALRARYSTIDGFDGVAPLVPPLPEVYPLYRALGLALPTAPPVTFYRRYLPTDKAPTFIHSDAPMAHFTAIVGLSPSPEGESDFRGHFVRFWRHKDSGLARCAQPTTELEQDGLDVNKWEVMEEVPLVWNQALIFDSRLWHSRWPVVVDPAHGSRLIKVYFIKP